MITIHSSPSTEECLWNESSVKHCLIGAPTNRHISQCFLMTEDGARREEEAWRRLENTFSPHHLLPWSDSLRPWRIWDNRYYKLINMPVGVPYSQYQSLLQAELKALHLQFDAMFLILYEVEAFENDIKSHETMSYNIQDDL